MQMYLREKGHQGPGSPSVLCFAVGSGSPEVRHGDWQCVFGLCAPACVPCWHCVLLTLLGSIMNLIYNKHYRFKKHSLSLCAWRGSKTVSLPYKKGQKKRKTNPCNNPMYCGNSVRQYDSF